jgi:hypothetical protein
MQWVRPNTPAPGDSDDDANDDDDDNEYVTFDGLRIGKGN